MKLFILALALTLVTGCTSFTRVYNGRTVLHSSCGIGGYSCALETNDQIYPTAQAKYGQMPGNLQDAFAVEEAVATHQQAMNARLYGGFYGGYGGYYPYRSMQYRFIMPQTGELYTPAPVIGRAAPYRY